MKNIMFLTQQISMGYGVSVVVHEICNILCKSNYNVYIGSNQIDYEIHGVKSYIIKPDPDVIKKFAISNKIDIIIAHTSPYFEVLPCLAKQFKCWAWEHGDPTPEFFDQDICERSKIIINKQKNVYPFLNKVIAISEFISHDIGYLNSEVIYNGCDHVIDFGKKTSEDINFSSNSPIKIGTLMRLGTGEAKYKGNNLFLELCEKLKKNNVNAEFYVMGRGTSEDAKLFEEKGYKVFRNASDDERSKYLRELDIFISPSQWEGFNLPVVEAMKSGTLSFVFDIGAHPEVCPFLFSSIDEMAVNINYCSNNRNLLLKYSEKCYYFVKNKFSWDKNVKRFFELLNENMNNK